MVSPYILDHIQILFEVLIWFRYINMASTVIENKTLFVNFSYLSGNSTGLVVHRVYCSWKKLMGLICN